MEHISDDLRHIGVVSDKELLPWHVQARKKDVPLFFPAPAETSEFTRFEPRPYSPRHSLRQPGTSSREADPRPSRRKRKRRRVLR
jgi:hypothetical protein